MVLWVFNGVMSKTPTTGPRDCHECGKLAYSNHEPWCVKVRDS